MKKLALLILLTLAPLTICAQSSQPSGNLASDCDPRVVKACAIVADQLKAARELIDSQAREIEATNQRLEVEKAQAQLQKEMVQLLLRKIDALQEKVTAVEESKALIAELNARQAERLIKLEEQKRAANKRTLFFAAAGVVIGFLASR